MSRKYIDRSSRREAKKAAEMQEADRKRLERLTRKIENLKQRRLLKLALELARP